MIAMNNVHVYLCRYECNCTDTGFNGTNCELNIDDCAPGPCQNEATCTDLIKVNLSYIIQWFNLAVIIFEHVCISSFNSSTFNHAMIKTIIDIQVWLLIY